MDRGPQITTEVQEGQVLAGKYRIERSIGEGGMGMVVAAHHLELDEPVAIKLLRPEALGNPEAVMRFSREARASVKIKSEHVARTLDVGKLENGAPYIVMEYLHGLDLSARLRKSGPLAIDLAVDFTLQACQALADAHAIGIVHRDIKPSNLFVIRKTDGNESIKVLDFGISKVTGLAATGTDMGMTRTQTIMGSPLYMSPEQMASSRDAGPSADIWALGVTLHELLTGKAPFEAESITELCSKVLTQTSPRLHEKRADIPDGLQSIIDRCLEKDPTKRYLNMAELAIALMPFGTKRGRIAAEGAVRVLQTAGMSVSSLVIPPSTTSFAPAPPAAQVTTGTGAVWSQTQPSARRRTGLLIGALAVALFIGAVAVAAVVMMRKSEPQTRAAAASPAVSAAAANAPVIAQPSNSAAEQAAPATSESSPIALASATASASAVASTQDTSNKPVPSRSDNKQKTASKHDKASPAASATPKGAPEGRSKPKPASGVTDFGGRLY